MTAAIYLARYERKILLLTEITGGQTTIAGTIENYPGFIEISGAELISKIREQVKAQANVEFKEGEKVSGVLKTAEGFAVKTGAGEYLGKTIILANGRRHRELGIGENQLIGKGISYCATCDGAFARQKDVAIVGGGYAAGEAALILEKIAESVTMINLNNELSGEGITIEKIKANPKIKVINNAKTSEIVEKNGLVAGLKYEDTNAGGTHPTECQMIFIEIGQIPNTEIVAGLVELNDGKEIKIDANNMASVERIFAAGDVTEIPAKQTVVACGEGAKAAIAANKFLNAARPPSS